MKPYGISREIVNYMRKQKTRAITMLTLGQELQRHNSKFPITLFEDALKWLEEEGYVQWVGTATTSKWNDRIALTQRGRDYFVNERNEYWSGAIRTIWIAVSTNILLELLLRYIFTAAPKP